MIEALKNISNGYYQGKVFEADGFGTKDYNIALDIVLDEMDYLWKKDNSIQEVRVSQPPLTEDERKRLKDKTLERILDFQFFEIYDNNIDSLRTEDQKSKGCPDGLAAKCNRIDNIPKKYKNIKGKK